MSRPATEAETRAETAAFAELERQAAVMADDSSTDVGPDSVVRCDRPGFEHVVMIDGAVDLRALVRVVILEAARAELVP